jgi:hypothetical protein
MCPRSERSSEMGSEEHITVGEVSTGSDAGSTVDLPVVELLTGRGFVTGKSGSGKSNTASVIAEKLLDGGYGLLIVDIDGEYYGLKEEYEILHVGADEECDLQVNAEHAEKLAELALQQAVPIILDISSFLDEEDAKKLLTEVAKHLFAKEKKLKQPFLLVVEEIHEWIPEGGGLDECGRMLIKIGKRGRKHGLGITGISQRPADVKKDFITQCDWLVWHRLTWGNDTKVVKRILGSEYADWVEELDDGEAFLMTDWAEELQRIQFQRKRTFDAGATPGLDDFERPELKSVSSDLVSDLEAITEQEQQREDRIVELERELAKKDREIKKLRTDLADARDLKQMADRFARAMMDHAGGRPLSIGGPGRQARLDDPDEIGAETASTTERPDPSDSEEAVEAEVVEAAEPRPEADDPTMEPEEVPWPEAFENAPIGAARPVVKRLFAELADLDPTTRGMLAYYYDHGPADPVDSHVAAGGSADRPEAYSRNRTLRQRGFIAHAGRGQYGYTLPEIVRDEHDDRLDEAELEAVLSAIESAFVGAHTEPNAERSWPEP